MSSFINIICITIGFSLLTACDDLPTGIRIGDPAGDVAAEQQPTPDAIAFRPDIQNDIDTLGCSSAGCHGGDILPMPLVANPLSDADYLANYQQVLARAGDSSSSLLMDTALGNGGHIAPMDSSDAMAERWREWIAQGAAYEIGGGSAGTGGSAAGGDEGGGNEGGAGPPPTDELSWESDIAPLVVVNACLDCHGNSGWQGAYSLASYDAALGFGTDAVPNVVPGDASSRLIEYAEAGHHEISATDALVIRTWVMDWEAQEN
jgi:hypothetical protein